MGVGISGGGSLGLAFETVPGTYVAPTKYHPILSESLEFMPGNVYRRPIRQDIDQVGVIPGNVSIQGVVSAEFTDDVLVYYLYAMRMGIIRTGTSPNFTYTCTPTSTNAFPTRTLSLTVVRNSLAFGYTGCVVSKLTLAYTNDILQMDFDIIGQNEAPVALPSPTWSTATPYGPGLWNIGIPTGTQVFDLDTFSYSITENAAPQYRMKNSGPNAGRGAQFVSMGERLVSMTASRDFLDRTDYNAFQAGIAQSITIVGQQTGNNSISLLTGNVTKSAMQIPLGAQGNIIRSNLTYEMCNDALGNATVITVQTQESIT